MWFRRKEGTGRSGKETREQMITEMLSGGAGRGAIDSASLRGGQSRWRKQGTVSLEGAVSAAEVRVPGEKNR